METTTLIQFISFLHRQNIEISTDGKQIFCDAPEGVLTAEIVEKITQRKSEIISFLNQISDVSQTSISPIQSVSKNKDIPLSFGQERLWFIDRLQNASSSYNEHIAFHIAGNLNVKAFQQAFTEIIKRHESLRTSFSTVNGTTIQVIHPDATSDLKLSNLQQLQIAEQKKLLEQKIKEQAITPFNLETAPLIRGILFQLTTTEYIFSLTAHHIISDGWSLGIFMRELSTLYQAFDAEQLSPLPELTIQYADYAIWQREWLSGQTLATQLNYWQSQLQNSPKLLQLPTDRTRPNIQTYVGKIQKFNLSKELTQQIQNLSKKSGTTLFMTLLAAYATLLYRYSDQSEVLIGSPIANRNRREIEPLIGFFVNTLVLKTKFEENPTVEELLIQVRETTLKAYEYQDVPFEKIVETLKPERSLSHSPLFQVMLVLQNTPMSELILPNLILSELHSDSTIAKFDLTLSVTETEDGLLGSWEYNSDLFDDSTIERMAGHFQNLLEKIVENPQQKVSELPLLSEPERHQLLVEWNDTQTEYPQDKCIHELFEEQVGKTPDEVAVVFEEQQLTYQELNQRANQLAHYLQTLGVEPEEMVGICIERSIEMVVGLLGILKAGGAYVPLDPEYPKERLNYLLSDARPLVLLTQQSFAESFPEYPGRLVCLDSDWELIKQQNQENYHSQVTAKNLAYVIYTSGSTGIPKGVMNTHLGISNRLYWMQEAYQLTESDRVLQKTPFSFDVSVWEFFWPLMTGAILVLTRPGGHQDTAYIAQQIARHAITTIHFVPSMLQVFLKEPHLKENCRSLKRVICSGEALPYALQECLFSYLECELHNLYGPTEASIDVTYWKCQLENHLRTVPIGRPISNTQIYILDPHLQPVPVGVPGELHIGGAGLARGYLNRRELTAEKFIPNLFTEGKRLYKTGDKARYLLDGNIEFLGRLDHQVKIRGFRIELDEIETALSQYLQVQQVTVIAREDTPGDKRLVAYLAFDAEPNPSIINLRQFLRKKLPEYMMPDAFVYLDSLPLTPNGKIDRRALPEPDITQQLATSYVAPRTPTEEILANIWANVLGIEQVGIHDNFFEIGGHSLLAIQVNSRLREIFSLELPVHSLFEATTIEKLSQLLITKENKPGQIEKIAQLLQQIDSMSAEEVEETLMQKQKEAGKV
jgi:amino acid adenylation domain-containing protein